MPFKRKYRSKGRKRHFKRRMVVGRKRKSFGRKRRRIQSVSKFGLYLPDVLKAKVKYLEWENVTTTAVNTGYQVYRGNGAYDPKWATGGSSPLGWSDISNMYQCYRCYGCKLKLTIFQNALSVTIISVVPTQDATLGAALTSYRDLERQKYAKTRTIHNRSYSGPQKTTLKYYMKTKKMWPTKSVPTDDAFVGMTNGVASADFPNYGAALNPGVPQNQWFWNILYSNVETVPTVNLWVKFELTYYCHFFMPRPASREAVPVDDENDEQPAVSNVTATTVMPGV